MGIEAKLLAKGKRDELVAGFSQEKWPGFSMGRKIVKGDIQKVVCVNRS